MWYNNKMLKDIIISWRPKYEDVDIQSTMLNEDYDIVTVNFRYKSEDLSYRSADNFSYFPLSINVHKRDIRDYRISKILN